MRDGVVAIKTEHYQTLVYKSVQLDLVKKIVASNGSYDMAKMLKTLFCTDVPRIDGGGEE